jgi:hypothetical protein
LSAGRGPIRPFQGVVIVFFVGCGSIIRGQGSGGASAKKRQDQQDGQNLFHFQHSFSSSCFGFTKAQLLIDFQPSICCNTNIRVNEPWVNTHGSFAQRL